MQKLLNALRNDPSEANKQKLQKYLAKHTMAACLLDRSDRELLNANGIQA